MVRDIHIKPAEQVVPANTSRHGLVIGIETYQNRKLNLKYVRRDAEAIYNVMVSPECGLFPEKNVQLLLDDAATQSGIRRAFSKLIRDANTDDTVWIFYAGHGGKEGDETYWVTHDADIHDLFGTALPRRDIAHFLNRISSKRVVTFLDCCHAEATVDAGARDALTAEEAFAAFQGEGRFTVCSCEGDQKSIELEEHEHGAFTHYLVEGLRGAADRAGQGVVLADDLWQYLEGRVTDAARHARNPQTPRLISNVSHRLALTLNPARLAEKAHLEECVRGLYGPGPDKLSGAECDLAIRLVHQGAATPGEKPLADYVPALASGSPDAVRAFKSMVQVLEQSRGAQPYPGPAPRPRVEPAPEPAPPEPEPKPAGAGIIYLEFEPHDAEVTLDGRKVEVNMGLIEDVPAGEHVLRVAARTYEPAERRVTVEPGRVAKQEPIRLERGQGALTVISTPPGASMFVDGRDTGLRSPDTLEVDAGVHKVELRLAGFRDASAAVELDVGETEVIRLDLAPLPKVHFESDPPGAEVTVSGESLGRTPLQLPLDPGEYEVMLALDGYEPKKGTLHVEEGKRSRVSVTLKPQSSRRLQAFGRFDAAGLPSGLALPKGSKDKWGNRVREGSDPASGLAWEVVLGDLGMPFVLCPAGEFMMGSSISPEEVVQRYGGEAKWCTREHPQHKVRITEPFYMGKYQVTNADYKAFLDASGYDGSGDAGSDYLKHFSGKSDMPTEGNYPIVWVSWKNCVAFCQWTSEATGARVQLPTEAQWEYACRAGSTTEYGFGDSESKLGDYAWYDENSGDETHPVGEKKPNEWGLYDLHGNVWEWCADWFDEDYYASSPTDDPTGPASGSYRVLRGGSWLNGGRSCRSADRDGGGPDYVDYSVGCRVALRVP